MLKKNRLWLYFLIPVWVFIFFKILLPFLLYNNLHIQDMAGHYFSAWFTKEYCFPHIVCWNPFHYFGFPQNQFYPPLYTILTALLGFIIPLKLAFKLVLCTSVLATPLSFYYFCRKIGFDEIKAGVGMLGMTSMLFAIEEVLGGNMFSTFNVGLVTNALALPLAFFYLGNLQGIFTKKGVIWPSILIVLVVLSHFFTAITISMISFVFFILNFSKKNTLIYLKHAGLSFFLSAFWLVPLLSHIKYAASSYSPYYFSPFMIIYAVIFLALIIAAYRSKSLMWLTCSTGLLVFVMILGSFAELQFHFYRIGFIIILLMVALFTSLLNKKASLIIAGIIFIAFMILSSPNILYKGVEDVDFRNFGRLDGRVMVAGPREVDIGWNTLPYLVPLQTGNPAVRGIFLDSSRNGWLLGGFFTELSGEDWNDFFDYETVYHGNKTWIIQEQLNLLNINHILSRNMSLPFAQKIEDDIVMEYSLYRVSNSSIVEVLNYIPDEKVVNMHSNAEWLYSESISNIFVDNGGKGVPSYAGTGDESVRIIEDKPGRLRFYVNSTKPVPVLVKMSYYPDWKAYEDGEEIKIYKASADLMILYGKGEILLTFERTMLSLLGIILSICGTISLPFFLIKKYLKQLTYLTL